MLGQRIRQARIAAGLTLRELAQQIGLSHTAIAKYESGKICPRPSVLVQIARTLNVKMEFFLQEQSICLTPADFSWTAKISKAKREAIEAQIKYILEKYLELESLLPPERQVSFEGPRFAVKHIEEVEEIAEELRNRWELGHRPIHNMASALEERGIKVLMLSRLVDKVLGYCCWANETIPVAVCRENLPGDLQRQILGHQLAHLILEIDRELNPEEIATRFAMAFLAPRTGLLNKIGTKRKNLDFDELCLLKQEYKISLNALARRALDLGIVSRDKYHCLCRDFQKLSWQGQEPGDEVEPERPLRFHLLIRQALAEGLISEEKAMALLNERRSREIDICCDYMRRVAAAFAREYLEDDELTVFTRLNNEDFYAYE